MPAPSLTGSRVRIQMTSARSEEERKRLKELTALLDFFLGEIPEFAEERAALRARLREGMTREDLNFNHELLRAFFDTWLIPYAGGPLQDAFLMLDAPYSNSPFLSGTGDAVLVTGFASPFLSVDLDLSYPQTTIVKILTEHIKRFQEPLRAAGLNRSLKERVERLSDARALREKQNAERQTSKSEPSLAKIGRSLGWTPDKARWVARQLPQLLTKEGVEAEGRQVSSRVWLSKQNARREAKEASARQGTAPPRP